MSAKVDVLRLRLRNSMILSDRGYPNFMLCSLLTVGWAVPEKKGKPQYCLCQSLRVGVTVGVAVTVQHCYATLLLLPSR